MLWPIGSHGVEKDSSNLAYTQAYKYLIFVGPINCNNTSLYVSLCFVYYVHLSKILNSDGAEFIQ